MKGAHVPIPESFPSDHTLLSRLLAVETEQDALDAAVEIVAELLNGPAVGVLRGRTDHLRSAVARNQEAFVAPLFVEALWVADPRFASDRPRHHELLAGRAITTIMLGEEDHQLGAICILADQSVSEQLAATRLLLLTMAFNRTIERLRRMAETRLLYEISLRLGSKLEMTNLVREVLKLTTSTFAAYASRIFLVDKRLGDLIMMFATDVQNDGMTPDTFEVLRVSGDEETLALPNSNAGVEMLRVPIDGSIAGQVVRQGVGMLYNNPFDGAFPHAARELGLPFGKVGCVPLMHHNRTIGALMVINRHDDPQFYGEDLQLLTTIASIITIMLSNARLYQRAVRDALTGAYNRGAFEAKLHEYWAAWEKTGVGFALFVLDLDHFKQVNDQFGHPVGDAVLRAVTRLIWEALREDDAIFRYGGEEFCAVLSGLVDLDAAERVAERLRAILDREVLVQNSLTIKVSASIGVALHPLHGAQTPQALLELADDAAYQAKRGGRNRVAIANLQ